MHAAAMKDAYEIAKDFQPSIAAIVALVGVIFAYLAAVMRVQFDRREAELERSNERLGLFLRLRTSLARTADDAERIAGEIGRSAPIPAEGEAMRVFPTERLAIFRPNELDEAWNYIHLIPRDRIAEISRLRQMLSSAEQRLEALEDRTLMIRFTDERGKPIQPIADADLQFHRVECDRILRDCKSVIDALAVRIDKMQPDID